ncbi:MAG: carbohydrate-binding domain-containing protein [Lachnospiraceae bacterium]|nr:carbohydrate-binding domain-containing protein [Lachnospiraceae bacterium]
MNKNHKIIRKVSAIAAGTALTGALVLSTGAFNSLAASGAFGMNAGRLGGFNGQNSMSPSNGATGANGTMQIDSMSPMGQMNQMSQNVELADSPGEIMTGITSNSAQYLTADESNAITYVMSDTNNSVKIDSAGTYIITGNCSDGNITVKKNTTGVVLILRDLDLTSTIGATLSCNKYSEVKIIVDGTVFLTDAENPDDEASANADVADAFDGAAIKIKDGASVYLTGTGVLNIDASTCKNGIKVGNDDEPSLVIAGSLSLNISAANDAINSGYDVAILSGTLTIGAGDDGIHADRVLTIGDGSDGPDITITRSYEGLEGTVVNLFGGNVSLTASDDGINAANSDGTYADLGYSINITAGTYTVRAGGDGLDSNENINITGGYTTINSASAGGEAGIDYDGTCYIADGTVNNNSGISGPDAMPGQMGAGTGMNADMGQQGMQQPSQPAQINQDFGMQQPTQPDQMNQDFGMQQPTQPDQMNQDFGMQQPAQMNQNFGMQQPAQPAQTNQVRGIYGIYGFQTIQARG